MSIANPSFTVTRHGRVDLLCIPRLYTAIIDRLTFAGPIIETGTQSYRLAHARAQRGTAP